MSNKILAAAIAAVLLTNKKLVEVHGQDKTEALVEQQIQVALPYFGKHEADKQFFITSNAMVFRKYHQAWNHVADLTDKRIVEINRADIEPLLEEQTNVKADAKKGKYDKAEAEHLHGLCKERGIEVAVTDSEDALRKKLEQHDKEFTAVVVDAKMLEDNPSLAQEDVKIGDTIYVPIQSETDNNPHLLASGNAKQIVSAIEKSTDLEAVKNTLAREQKGNKRKSIIDAAEARIKELSEPEA